MHVALQDFRQILKNKLMSNYDANPHANDVYFYLGFSEPS